MGIMLCNIDADTVFVQKCEMSKADAERKRNSFCSKIRKAKKQVWEILKDQESLAYEELRRIWDERIEGPVKELSGRLEILSEMVLSYINGMTAYVEPEDACGQERHPAELCTDRYRI